MSLSFGTYSVYRVASGYNGRRDGLPNKNMAARVLYTGLRFETLNAGPARSWPGGASL